MFTISNSKKTRRTFTETAEVALRALGSDTKVDQRLSKTYLYLVFFLSRNLKCMGDVR